MPEKVIVTIGTKKGLFVAEAPKSRATFTLRGPFGSGVSVYSSLIDTRGRGTPSVLASSCNAFFGMKVLRSTDLGKTFKETKSAPAFPPGDGRALANIWSLEPGSDKNDKKELLCGVEPASLFRSEDGGDSWEMVPGISNHDHARKWQPGNGGLFACTPSCAMETKMHLGISTGGHYLSDDGGKSFNASNKGIGVGFSPDPFPEFGQCVHKIARHPDAPNRLYMQNHGGFAERPGIGACRRRQRAFVALDREGPSVRFWISDRGPSARRGHRVCRAARTDDAHVSGRRAGRLAQRERRRVVETAHARIAEEGKLLHDPA